MNNKTDALFFALLLHSSSFIAFFECNSAEPMKTEPSGGKEHFGLEECNDGREQQQQQKFLQKFHVKVLIGLGANSF